MNDARLFSTLHHVCVVVRDIEKSVAYYESVGVGPWHDYPPLESYQDDLTVPDREAFFGLKYKYANLGNVQIQLCEPGEGGSPQWRFLDSRGEGVFHLGFMVPDADDAETEAAKLGIEPLMRGRQADGCGFTYFDTAEHGAGVILEVRSVTSF